MRQRAYRRVRVYRDPMQSYIGRVLVQRGASPFKTGSGTWKDFGNEYHLAALKDARRTARAPEFAA